MEEEPDYRKLKFKCGIEIHQQLETHKLFCECPSIVHDKNPDVNVKRKLLASEGESGEIDVAALYEQKKGKYYVYEACTTSSCLVELDEEPPHAINDEALEIVLQISQMLNATIVDQIRVMRKTVIDGSNPGGFQRTALVARNGHIDTSKGRVNIPTICIEEEAAKKIIEDRESVTYRLDRLGVALVEIGTAPDIKDPEHAKEVAEKLGMILRSTGKVKRGIGSIRQDVNISIEGGARTEIKGFQDLKSIPKVIKKEVARQFSLIKKGKKIAEEVRKAEPDMTTTFLRPIPSAARMYPETDVKPIVPEIKKLKKVEGIHDKLERFEKKYNLNTDIAKIILKKGLPFEDFVNSYINVPPKFISEVFVSMPKEIRKRYDIDAVDIVSLSKEPLDKLNKGEINKEAVIEVIVELAKGKTPDYSKFKTVSDDALEKEIKKIVDENKGAPFGALMGIAMSKFRGKVDGKKVSEILRKHTS